MAVFIFMGSIVLYNMQEPRESVNVQLLKAIQPERKLRRNSPEPRNWTVVQINLPEKAHDTVKPIVGQENACLIWASHLLDWFC